jgi:uncharacterized sporulation protein YeaH/YhbH (DUF444 family)
MTRPIERDRERFRQIVRGEVKKHLRRYVTEGELVGRVDGKAVSIPVPGIELPRFRYGSNEEGVGSGDGQDGGGDTSGDLSPEGRAGSDPGRHALEVEVSLDELAEVLGEELGLPRIEPKGQESVEAERARYRTLARKGPESLRHGRRTYVRALKRMLVSGGYDPRRPAVVPEREDRVYKAPRLVPKPHANAVIVYAMDVSGSMGGEQKEVVRTTAFWIDTWLRRHYPRLERRFIVHDAAAKEVSESEFYTLREGGGTRISSAYGLAGEMLERDYPAVAWNSYLFHFSDGDNWTGDSLLCERLLRSGLLERLNLFSYGQVESRYGSGEFISFVRDRLDGEENVVAADIRGRPGILDAIRVFLGTGR